MDASSEGHKEVIELLLKHGADRNIRANVSITAMIFSIVMCTCLFVSIYEGSRASVCMRVCVIDVFYDRWVCLKACMFVSLRMRE